MKAQWFEKTFIIFKVYILLRILFTKKKQFVINAWRKYKKGIMETSGDVKWFVNPISVGLIFDDFLCPPPSKIGPNWARKILKTYLESSQKIMGGIIYTQNAKKCHLLG